MREVYEQRRRHMKAGREEGKSAREAAQRQPAACMSRRRRRESQGNRTVFCVVLQLEASVRSREEQANGQREETERSREE
jgi:hypothetical protein